MTNQKKFFLILAGIIVLLAGVLIFWNFRAVNYTQDGITAFNAGNFAEAKVNFVKALDVNSKDAIAYFYLGKIALGQPDIGGKILYPNANFKEAIDNYEKSFLSDLKGKDESLYNRAISDAGFAYWAVKNYAKADENFIAHIAAVPESAYASRYLLALDYIERFNKPKEAVDILLPAIDAKVASADFKAGRDFKIYSLLARLYAYFKNYQNAEKYAKLAIQSGGVGNKDLDIQYAHSILAIVYAKLGNIVAAENEVGVADDLAGSPKAYTCSLASVDVIAKNYTKAISVADSVKASDSYGYSICLRALADANLGLGNKVQAKKYFKEYIKMADTLVEKNIFVARGLEEARKALSSL